VQARFKLRKIGNACVKAVDYGEFAVRRARSITFFDLRKRAVVFRRNEIVTLSF